MKRIIPFPYSVPPEVALYGYEANRWANAERERLGFKMEPIRWENLDEYVEKHDVMVSLFPVSGTDEAMLRVDWFEKQLTKYVRLTNYRKLQLTHKDLIDQLLRNGIMLYLANRQNPEEK